MSYKELQKEAKTLGIKYVGVSGKKLKKAIAVAKSESAETPLDAPEPKVNKDVNAAVVFAGKNEVRRYTADLHGKNFAELAKRFAGAKDRDYKVELINVEPGIPCPNCGSIVNT